MGTIDLRRELATYAGPIAIDMDGTICAMINTGGNVSLIPSEVIQFLRVKPNYIIVTNNMSVHVRHIAEELSKLGAPPQQVITPLTQVKEEIEQLRKLRGLQTFHIYCLAPAIEEEREFIKKSLMTENNGVQVQFSCDTCTHVDAIVLTDYRWSSEEEIRKLCETLHASNGRAINMGVRKIPLFYVESNVSYFHFVQEKNTLIRMPGSSCIMSQLLELYPNIMVLKIGKPNFTFPILRECQYMIGDSEETDMKQPIADFGMYIHVATLLRASDKNGASLIEVNPYRFEASTIGALL